MKDGLLDNFVLVHKPKHEEHLNRAWVQDAFLKERLHQREPFLKA
jgi:hypothetical protein